MVDMDEEPSQIFSGIFEYAELSKNCIINKDCIIHNNEIYERITSSEKTISEILNDPTDFREMIKNTDNSEEKMHYAQLLGIKRLAVGVSKELDNVFNILFK